MELTEEHHASNTFQHDYPIRSSPLGKSATDPLSRLRRFGFGVVGDRLTSRPNRAERPSAWNAIVDAFLAAEDFQPALKAVARRRNPTSNFHRGIVSNTCLNVLKGQLSIFVGKQNSIDRHCRHPTVRAVTMPP